MILKKENGLRKIIVYLLALFILLCLTGCGKGNDIVGSWVSEDNEEMVKFNDDGSCSAPFTYNAAWIESANAYTVKDDGTLVFSSESGHANKSYEKVESEEEALDNKSTYYISGDILIINKDKYTRAN